MFRQEKQKERERERCGFNYDESSLLAVVPVYLAVRVLEWAEVWGILVLGGWGV